MLNKKDVISECSYCGKDLEPIKRCCEYPDCSCQFNFCNRKCTESYNQENDTML